MCGVLSGTGFGAMLGPDNVGHFFGAVRIDLFQPIDTFKATMDDLIRELRATPPKDRDEPVLVAGDLEHAAEAERRALGIPLHPRVLEMLERYAVEFGLDCDLTD